MTKRFLKFWNLQIFTIMTKSIRQLNPSPLYEYNLYYIKNQSKAFRKFCSVRKFCKEGASRGLVVKIDLDKSEVGFSRIFKMSQPI